MMVGALLAAITFLASIVFRPFWPFLVIRFLQGLRWRAWIRRPLQLLLM